MGGTVNSVPRTPAEQTAVFLQQAAQSGAPVSIPGAREARAGLPPARPTDATELPVTHHGQTPGMSDRERLEYEREGGGAPSERGGGRATILARLWRTMFSGRSQARNPGDRGGRVLSVDRV
jgi:hypothetical protein